MGSGDGGVGVDCLRLGMNWTTMGGDVDSSFVGSPLQLQRLLLPPHGGDFLHLLRHLHHLSCLMMWGSCARAHGGGVGGEVVGLPRGNKNID